MNFKNIKIKIQEFYDNHGVKIIKVNRYKGLKQSVVDHKLAKQKSDTEKFKIQKSLDNLKIKYDDLKSEFQDELKNKDEEYRKLCQDHLYEISQKEKFEKTAEEWKEKHHNIVSQLGGERSAKKKLSTKIAEMDQLIAEVIAESERKENELNANLAEANKIIKDLTEDLNKARKFKDGPATKKELEEYELTRKAPERFKAARKFRK